MKKSLAISVFCVTSIRVKMLMQPAVQQLSALISTCMYHLMPLARYRFFRHALLLLLFGVAFSIFSFAQNQIIGTGFTAGWSNPANLVGMTASAGGSQIITRNATAIGNCYFRFASFGAEQAPNGGCSGGDVNVTASPNTVFTAASWGCTNGAYYITTTNTSDNYVFKTPSASNNQFVYFRLQGAVQTMVSTTRYPSAGVYQGQNVTVNLTTSGTTTGQDFYLRYTNNGYATSSVVKLTGSGTSYSGTIPAAVNTVGATVSYYFFSSGTSNVAANGSNADYYTINLLNNGGSNYSYVVKAGYITATSGNFNTGSTWVGGVVPPTGASVVILSGHTVTLDIAISLKELIINTGGIFIASNGTTKTLAIQNAGLLTNDGTFTATAFSNVNFLGTGTINGANAITFNSLAIVGGGVAFQTAPTINVLLRILGGFVSTNAPNYNSGSTLQYGTNGTYLRSLEWSATSGPGYPQNVQITSNTTVDLGGWGGSATMRQCAGNLTIDPGSVLSMNESGNAMSAALRVLGNVIVNGTLRLGGAIGGDLQLSGNYTVGAAGSVINNRRATIFEGASGNQIVTKTGTGTLYFDYLIVNKTTGNLQFTVGTDATIISLVNNDLSLRVLQLLKGDIDLNDGIITLQGDNANSMNVLVSGAQRKIFSSTGSGEFRIRGSVSATGATKFNVISQSSGSLLFDNNVVVSTSVGVDFGTAGISTINAIFRIDRYGYTIGHSPNYGTASTLIYNNGTDGYKRNFEWNTATYGAAGTGFPNHVIVQNNTTVQLNSTDFPATFALGCSGNLTIDAGSAITTDAMAYPISIGGNIVINGSLTLSTNAGGLLNVAGSWSRTGTFVQNDRNVNFNGNTNATLSATGGQSFSFMTLNKSNSTASLTINDAVAISDSLGLTRGTLVLNNKAINILSTALKTARIGVSSKVNTNITYIGALGKFFVQRYMPARRAWRLITAPFEATNAPTINVAWQDGSALDFSTAAATITSIAADTTSASFATQITGGLLSNGFDRGQLNNASIKYYDAGTWYGPANTNATAANSKEGWMLFVRGDRENFGQITTQYKTPTVTTLRPRGQIILGDKTISSTGITVVGNPYASAIDFTTITKTGALSGVNTYTVWDPTLGGTFGAGAFVTLTWNGTNFTRSNLASTFDNRYIPSGAAVMVDFAAGGTLTIKESDKNAANTTSAFRAARNQIFASLYVVENDQPQYVVDGAALLLDQSYSAQVDQGDALKLGNFSENFGIATNGKILSIERRPITEHSDTIQFFMNRMRIKNYRLQLLLQQVELGTGIQAYLEDRYLHQKMVLQPADTNWYNFTVTSDSASFSSNRFRMVLAPMVQLKRFTAVVADEAIRINWEVNSEWNLKQYQLERSENGQQFEVLHVQPIVQANDAGGAYQWLDQTTRPGTYYYRLVIKNNADQTYTGEVVQIERIRGIRSAFVYPNPVRDGRVRVQMGTYASGVYAIRLVTPEGHVALRTSIQHQQGEQLHVLPNTAQIRRGIYFLEITEPNHTTARVPVVVE